MSVGCRLAVGDAASVGVCILVGSGVARGCGGGGAKVWVGREVGSFCVGEGCTVIEGTGVDEAVGEGKGVQVGVGGRVHVG
ncbi:MAG: hypothetical protein J7M05_08225, partial [Anaerolineae bacterium]|nr:hypothetical protein [Anaerolineae bacterium]